MQANSPRLLSGSPADYDDLVERAASARFVLLGEASHGTHEFYRERAEITRRLIVEGHVTAVAIEGDWPDAYRVNRFVRGLGADADADSALAGFRRFPTWMWRNVIVRDFVTWMRGWNDSLAAGSTKVGFYGLDLYSLHASMDAVVSYLATIDPAAAERARRRYACFDHFGPDPQTYAYETSLGGAEPCEPQVVEQLLELQRRRFGSFEHLSDNDRQFCAVQNARLVRNAERYYRSAFRAGASSWNLRDAHMAETLEALAAHLDPTGGGGDTVVVWAHNSHVGDARATELGAAGEFTLGQLVRERYPDQTLLVGFTTHSGTVTAADDWGDPPSRKTVRPALPDSWEERFHRTGVPRFLLWTGQLAGRRLERAIGVVYRPQTERQSHYFHSRLQEQFDVVIHLDETTAVVPLERWAEAPVDELFETYPWTV